MQTRIEKIDDNLGLILPKELLDSCGFREVATVTVHNNTLVVSPSPRRAREGWDAALKNISQAELDRDFEQLQAFRETPHSWDNEDWQWPEGRADEKI